MKRVYTSVGKVKLTMYLAPGSSKFLIEYSYRKMATIKSTFVYLNPSVLYSKNLFTK